MQRRPIEADAEALAFERWMVERALPLWAGAGRDAAGAFHERLTLDGAPDSAAIRRVRVQFRQIYVYAAADLLGLHPGGADIALAAFDRIRQDAWAADGQPGWAHLLNPDRTVLDGRRDAYDQAFALFAMAWLWRAKPTAEVASAIAETLAFVDDGLSARSGGWWERAGEDDGGDGDLRRQNPHMHALEAMLALYEATGERAYLDRAREIYHLFAARFYDWPSAVVIEYFDADWRRAPDAHQRIEPGHMAEWVYLIREYERLTGEPVAQIADPLFAKTIELGLDESGRFLLDELTPDGRPSKPGRRLWPQTERLKAALTQYRAHGDEALRQDAAQALADLRGEYLSGVVAGGWRDAFDGAGAPAAETMPASTLYHLFSAFALSRDLLRRRPKAEARASARKGGAVSDAKQTLITPVVLAGGRGSRLWPLSQPATPKQFLALISERTMLQETLLRVADAAVFARPMVVCHHDYAELASRQAQETGVDLARLVLEPVGRNSAPAIAAAAELALAEDPDALLLITPADHMIRETSLFRRLVDNAAAAASDGLIVTFGVTPTRVETGYGYIAAGAPLGVAGAFEIDSFVEKPGEETVRQFLAAGSYLWNSGMFLFRAADYLAELERWRPEIRQAVGAAVANGAERDGGFLLDAAAMDACPSDSIDYAVMENTERGAVCPAALTWSDIGSWDSLAAAQGGDAAGNAVRGPATLLDCSGVYARSDGPRIAAIGVQDLVIVVTEDTVLVTPKSQAQHVKKLAEGEGG